MRWSRFMEHGQEKLGIWKDGGLLHLADLDPALRPNHLVMAGSAVASHLDWRLRHLRGIRLVDPATIRFLPPLLGHRVLCAGLNYRSHAEETGLEIPHHPTFFLRHEDSLAGHGDFLRIPEASSQLDYEGELAVILGRECHGIMDREDALAIIAGYTILNDGSIRDYQFRSSQWTLGKNFPASGACGPWVTSAEEVPAGATGLRVETFVGGERLQSGNTTDLIFDVADLIRELASCMFLRAGDLVATGTPSGVGFTRDPPRFLRPGDRCRIEIEGIGVLENPVT